MITLRAALLIVGCLMVSSVAVVGQTAEGTKNALKATVTADGAQAHVAWRYSGEMPQPLKTLSASVNGRVLDISAARAYPSEGDRTAMMFLVDITGGDSRLLSISQSKARLVRLYDSVASQHVIALGAIDGDVRLIIPLEDEPVEPLTAMLQLNSTLSASRLGGATAFAIDALKSTDAARRGAYIFTDGHSESGLDPASLIAAAKAADVVLNFVVDQSDRPADTDVLKEIATATGGIYAEGDAAARFIDAPFRFLDSGATADISLLEARHYPWEEKGKLNVVFDFGIDQLSLDLNVDIPDATVEETAQYLWQNHGREIAAGAGGLGWILVLTFGFSALRYRRRLRVIRSQYPLAMPVEIESAGVAPEMPTSDSAGRDMTPPQADTVTTRPSASGSTETLMPLSEDPTRAPSRKITVPVLRLLSDGRAGSVDIELEDAEISIGRASSNMVILAGDTISGRHAILRRESDGDYILVNLSQTNPTRANGEEIAERRLHPGDRIAFGEVDAEFLLMPAADNRSAQ